MNIRFKVLSVLSALGLLFAAWSPTYAAGAAVSGRGKVVCDGDGVVVFGGDFVRGTFSTSAGAIIHTWPTKGSIRFEDATGFIKQAGSGDLTVYVGYGTAIANEVRNVKVTLSGADAHFEVLGRGRLIARGDGACSFNGQFFTLKPDTDIVFDVTQ